MWWVRRPVDVDVVLLLEVVMYIQYIQYLVSIARHAKADTTLGATWPLWLFGRREK